MSRVINPDSSGKERTRLSKSAALAIRELASLREPGEESRDLAAFLVLALGRISETVEESVVAWEKRGYWVKADRFRMEWGWTQTKSDLLFKYLQEQNWDGIIQQVVQVSQKLSAVKVPARKPQIDPWTDAYKLLMSESK